MLSQHHQVVGLDVDPEKVSMINQRRSPIADELLQEYLTGQDLDLRATTDAADALGDAEWVIVATPTNYDEVTNYFDTSSVEKVLTQVSELAPQATVVIKSTITAGLTTQMRQDRKSVAQGKEHA